MDNSTPKRRRSAHCPQSGVLWDYPIRLDAFCRTIDPLLQAEEVAQGNVERSLNTEINQSHGHRTAYELKGVFMNHLWNRVFRGCVALFSVLEICAVSAFSADAGEPGGILSFSEAPAPGRGVWSAVGAMEYERDWFTATTLRNGRVLVAGGYSYETYTVTDAELFDSTTRSWTETGEMHFGRYSHTATLLANGRVLVAGGYDGDEMSSAEIYNPAVGTWSNTGSLSVAREQHAATLLQDGRVLVVGGYGDYGTIGSTELFNPATGRWTLAGNLPVPLSWTTATTLGNGLVLVAGGYTDTGGVANCELFDPSTGRWSQTGRLHIRRFFHTATLMADGRVLVAGGDDGSLRRDQHQRRFTIPRRVYGVGPAI